MSANPSSKSWHAEFLDEQEVASKKAMRTLAGNMADTLREVVDPRPWTSQFPWAAVGTAAVVGAISGKMMGSKSSAASAPAAPQPVTSQPSVGKVAAKSSLLATLTSSLIAPLVNMLVQRFQKSLHQALATAMAPPPARHNSTGPVDSAYADDSDDRDDDSAARHSPSMASSAV